MSETLLQKLEKLTNQALLNCGSVQPTPDKPPEFQWGMLQGKYQGLLMAVKLVAQFEDDEETFRDEM